MSPDVRKVFIAAVNDKLAEAETKFGVDMSDVMIELNIRGYRMAGQACGPKFNRKTGKRMPYRVRFHPEYIMTHLKEMIEVTVPHEVAHIVCMKDPSRGRGHDAGWRRTDLLLGGTGDATHSMMDGFHAAKAKAPVRQRTQYIYRTTAGVEVPMGPVRHKKCQAGTVYSLRGGGRILANGFIKKVVA